MRKITKEKIGILIAWIIALVIPLTLILFTVLPGNIAFWYDPARDFLLAVDNLHKISLIGETSGIPGFFYGPYWIWLISLGLLISKDPRIVDLLIITLPYFILMPIILYKFGKIFGQMTSILLFLLFMLSPARYYASELWNPHDSPLLFLLLLFLLSSLNFSITKQSSWKVIISGIVAGLLINLNFAFGVGSIGGVLLFFVLYCAVSFYRKKFSPEIKKLCKNIVLFLAGIAITFIPFFLFEVRHGFNQTKAMIKVFTTHGSVVSVTGLSKVGILQQFFEKLGSILNLSQLDSYVFLLLGAIFIIYQIKQKNILLKKQEIILLSLLGCISFSILFVYLTSKNPVWSYHFIGVEIIFLLITGFIISKIKIYQILLAVWLLYLAVIQLQGAVASIKIPPNTSENLNTKEYVVKLIMNNAKNQNYVVHTYSPSLYVYDYSYLFLWIAHKDIPYRPELISRDAPLAYVIVPPATVSVEKDFLNSRTPSSKYKTVEEWKIPDGTDIFKRVKK